MNRTYLRQLLLSTNRLFITAEGYTSVMMDCFPLIAQSTPVPSAFFVNANPPTYKEIAGSALKQLIQTIKPRSELKDITITDDFSSQELAENTIAYHRVFGFITSSSRWYFSSKQFEQDLLTAESNPTISCHFLHINSPGGEAWYLDRLSETMQSLQKPVLVLLEKSCASAGYYIACHSPHIYALTLNDQIGCIGTMLDYLDFESYYEKLGIKRVSVKSSYSDLKNKKYDDLRKGHPEQFIKEELDPLSEQFLAAVKKCRPKLAALPEDDSVFRGETFNTQNSISNGLIDGCFTFAQSVAEANRLGQEYTSGIQLQKSALRYV